MFIPPDCKPPGIPLGGSWTNTGTKIGETATFSCSNNLTIIGVNTSTCTAAGGWNGTAPTCGNSDTNIHVVYLNANMNTRFMH